MKFFFLFSFCILFYSCEKDIFKDENNNPQFIFDSFWGEIDRHYSFFPYTSLNWDSVYKVYKTRVTENSSDSALFHLFSNSLDLLHDAHTNIFTPLGISGNIRYFSRFRENQLNSIDSYFDVPLQYGKIFNYGKLNSVNLGYIQIRTFEGEHQSFFEIDSILQKFRNTSGLIIDVRSNRGGLISNCEIVAGRLADSTRIACKYRLRNGKGHNDFSEWINYYISPAKNAYRYNKPIAVLTNRFSYSATEWFVLFADAFPNVTIVGDTTGGGSGIPIIRELPNGWLLRISNSQNMIPSGRDFQVTGLYPELPVWITYGDALKNIDTILENAIATLTKLNWSTKHKVNSANY